MSEEERLNQAAERDEIFANEITPLGVTKEDQSGPRAEREAAISGNWAPGPGSGPEGTGADLGSYPGGPHPRGQGPNQPDDPALGGRRTTTRENAPRQPAGKMTHKPHGGEEEEARGPKTYGKPEVYAMDDQRVPYEDTHEGDLSRAGGSSGSGGGGEQILDAIQGEQELDQTQRASATTLPVVGRAGARRDVPRPARAGRATDARRQGRDRGAGGRDARRMRVLTPWPLSSRGARGSQRQRQRARQVAPLHPRLRVLPLLPLRRLRILCALCVPVTPYAASCQGLRTTFTQPSRLALKIS